MAAILPLIALAALAVPPAPAPAQPASTAPPPGLFDTLFGSGPEPSDASAEARAGRDDLNLVRLVAGDLLLSDTLPLYPAGKDWCAPPTALLDALEVAHERTASGLAVTLFEPRRSREIADDRLAPSPDGPCLALADAARLVDARLDYDPTTLELSLVDGDAIPAVERHRREDSRTRRMGPAVEAEARYPRLDNPWRWASVPTVDLSLAAGWSGGSAAATLVAEGSGDLALATARWRVIADSRGQRRLSGRLERVDPDGGMLGQLAARRIEAGDIVLPGQPLIGGGLPARGLVVSGAPEWRADILDRLTIEGALPPGWRAELSIDDRLVGFADTPDRDGRYRFDGVPLKAGFNRFVVELFGPHGERERRVVTRQVGSAHFGENETFLTFGVAAPVSETAAQAPPAAVFATLAQGVSDRLSARLDVRRAWTGRAHGAALSLDASVLGGAAGLSIARRAPGGLAAALAFSRRLGNWSLTVGGANFGTAPSAWAASEERDLARRASISLSGPVALLGRKLMVAVGAERREDRRGVVLSGLTLSTATRIGPVRLSHEALATWGVARLATGALAVDWTKGRTRVRSQLAYRAWPSATLQRIGVDVDHGDARWAVRTGAAFDLAARDPSLALGVSRRLGALDLGLDAGWTRARGPTIGAALRVAVGRMPGGRIAVLPPGASRAAILVPTLRDEQQRAVPGGRYLVANSLRGETGDEDGETLIGGIAPNRPVSMALQLSSLDDDRLRPDRPGVELVARPGQIVQVPIRVTRTGTVEIRLVRVAGDRRDPLAGVALTLEGRGSARSATSDFDGYALFDGLPFGTYTAVGTVGGVSRRLKVDLSAEADDRSLTLEF